MAEVTIVSPAVVVSITPIVSTTPAYTAGDVVGGKMTLSAPMRTAGRASAFSASTIDAGTAIIQSVCVVENGSQKAPMDILIFKSDPSASTFTDNGVATVNTADISKIVARISILATDYATVGGASVANGYAGITVPVGADTNTLYAVAVTSGTPTYTSISALTFNFGILQN